MRLFSRFAPFFAIALAAAALIAAVQAPACAAGALVRSLAELRRGIGARGIGQETDAPAGDAATQPAGVDNARLAREALATIDNLLKFDPQLGDRLLGLHGGAPVWREWAGSKMKPATAWPLGQLLAAELDIASASGNLARADVVLAELDRYKRGDAYGPGHRSRSTPLTKRYYDDNAWIGIDLLQAFRQTGNRKYLDQARGLAPFMEGGIQPGGGILWVEGSERPSFNTCSLAPSIQYFLGLYQATGDARFLDDAKRLEPVLNERLRRTDALYDDNVAIGDPADRSGTIYSYNQGAAIDANLQFSLVAKDPAEKARFLDLARKTVDAILARITSDPDWLWKQSPAFNAILFRNLFKFDAVAREPRIRAALDAYLDRAVREARRPGNGAYELGGIGQYDGDQASGITLIDQAGFVQMFALRTMTRRQVVKLG